MMSGFSASWLALREPYDRRARNADVLNAMAARFREQSSIAVVDLGCGTGSTLRAISPRLPAQQNWRLVDNDLSLLAHAAGLARPPKVTVAARTVDLALSPVVRILAMAAEMAGNESRAVIWFKHQPIPGWAGKTAYDLVRERKTDKVLAYLEAVRSGVYA